MSTGIAYHGREIRQRPADSLSFELGNRSQQDARLDGKDWCRCGCQATPIA
jgi:hypothetical protein